MPYSSLIPVGAWLWDKYGKSLTDKTAGAIKGQWDKFRWVDAAEKYRAKLRRLYGTMQIMGMAEPVPLDDIFTDVYMLDKPTAFGRFDIERLKQVAGDPDEPPPQAKRINGLRLVKEKGNLFILGKPGAGKTTFLKYVALQATEQNIDKVPIFVTLKHWADSGLDLIPFILERFEVCDFPSAYSFIEALLMSGNAIVLFDGLDEVKLEGGGRDKQMRAMNTFFEKYDRTQCLVTCRIAASEYSFQPFTYVEIADFTQRQIETFVGNWFRDQSGEKDEETGERFLEEFAKRDNKGLRDLARTPLLLTLLCLAFNETLTFPQRRVEIYEEALDALLKKWDSSRRIKRDEIYRKLSLGHKENMLASIAADTFERNEYFIPQQQLESLISNYVKNIPPHDNYADTDGEIILKAIEAQHGIFVERAHGVYSFSHLTFQEYFTAKHIAGNAVRGSLLNLIKAHRADKRWREVFALTTSLLPDATQFMTAFRQTVDEVLGSDEKLRMLLTWASSKSTNEPMDKWKIRIAYIDIALRYWARNPLLGDALYFAVSRNLGSEQVFPDPTFHVSRKLVRLLAIADDFARFRLVGIIDNPEKYKDLVKHVKNEIAHADSLSRQLKRGEFAKVLGRLVVPTGKWDAVQWKQFVAQLRELVIQHFDIGHEYNLSKREESRLGRYLQSTTLLQDCLEIAVISPETKKSIQESLFLPPRLNIDALRLRLGLRR
jgi:NACHT conflict system protein/NACHT domain-containing protein